MSERINRKLTAFSQKTTGMNREAHYGEMSPQQVGGGGSTAVKPWALLLKRAVIVLKYGSFY